MSKDKLTIKWSKKEQDFMIDYPVKCDGSLIHSYIFCASLWLSGGAKEALIKELEARGYDLTTLKFSIKKKK